MMMHAPHERRRSKYCARGDRGLKQMRELRSAALADVDDYVVGCCARSNRCGVKDACTRERLLKITTGALLRKHVARICARWWCGYSETIARLAKAELRCPQLL